MRQRPALGAIDESVEEQSAAVKVTLEWSDKMFEGSANGSAASGARPRLVGRATLRAVELFTDDSAAYELIATATSDLGNSRVAMAQVADGVTGERFVGSALISENDPSLATARAVLDAINRRLSQSLLAEGTEEQKP